jgi:hypothetical protein
MGDPQKVRDDGLEERARDRGKFLPSQPPADPDACQPRPRVDYSDTDPHDPGPGQPGWRDPR